MKRYLLLSFLTVLTSTIWAGSGLARRANPTTGQARGEFYPVDSDDDSPLTPTYNFVDTTYGTWGRVTTWSNTDDGFANLPSTIDSIFFYYYSRPVWVLQPPEQITPPPPGTPFMSPGSGLSTNGTITLNGRDSSPVNIVMPSAALQKNLLAPLWADWEFRTTGDSTKVFVRVANDSFYVSYYNLALKGTNGLVRATFQVAFAGADSTITFAYKSFDGSFNGVSAAALIQQVATIGLTDGGNGFGVMYLHKGYYFATNPNPNYNQPLHNHLCIKFWRMPNEAFLISSVTMPPNDRYELTTTQLTPQCKIQNVCDTAILVFVQTTITNLTTSTTIYNKYDSISCARQAITTYNAPLASNLSCASYKITFTISYRNNVSDQYAGNNTVTRYFVGLSNQSVPFREDFDGGISSCVWSNAGADARSLSSIMRVGDAPNTIFHSGKAVVLNRLDANGNPYPIDVGGDTLASAPFDLSQSSSVYLYFHYQRGLSTDSAIAGIINRLQAGPDVPLVSSSGVIIHAGDSLLVEGLKRSGSKWNPTESDWGLLGVIPGGFDATTQTFRVLLDTSYLHNHFRVRFRLKARNGESVQNYFEDADNFVIDAVHLEPFQAHKTEFEPIDVDLGNGPYTHVPRNLAAWTIPKVRILNNGDGVDLGVSLLHVTIVDALARIVYDQTRPFTFPSGLTDSIFPMAAWNLQGSQGPSFTVYVTIGANYFESYPTNDTNIFYKTLYIDDTYALDDGQPDTVGTTTTPATNFYCTFHSATSSGNDTLRGVAFYYRGSSPTSNWTLTLVGNGDSATRTVSLSPTAKGWYRGSFTTPYIMRADSVYRIHFVMSSGSNLGGDASNGLAYYTYIDSTTASNTRYGFFRPDVLGLFATSSRVSYLTPSASTVDQGGYLLPMFRLVTSGASTYLPIELLSLDAYRTSTGSAVIQWKMASEDEIVRYEVERTEDGMTVGTAIADRRTNYSLTDINAPATPERYRLTAYMQDGSKRILSEVQLNSVSDLQPLTLQVSPNPASDRLTLMANSLLNEIQVVDPLGRSLKSFILNDSEAILDTRDLPVGSYWLLARSGSTISHIRVIVIH